METNTISPGVEESVKDRVCAHCESILESTGGEMCEACKLLPRCEICEVIFGGLVSASQDNPDRCDGCLDYERFIEFDCVGCGNPIPIYVSKKSPVPNYVLRGNWCPTCNSKAKKSSMEAKEHPQDQFIGYLALMKNLYDGGLISTDAWETAVRANPHDVLYWMGIEDLQDEEDDTMSMFDDVPIDVEDLEEEPE